MKRQGRTLFDAASEPGRSLMRASVQSCCGSVSALASDVLLCMHEFPTRCLLVLMLDLNDRLGRPRAEESSKWERETKVTVPHDLELSCDVTLLQCHQHFTWRLPHFIRICCHTPVSAILTHLRQFFGRTKAPADSLHRSA